MSAQVLREAAVRARRSGTAPEPLGRRYDDPRHLAIAKWLDACAEFIESDPGFTWGGEDHALNVARAYLGLGSES